METAQVTPENLLIKAYEFHSRLLSYALSLCRHRETAEDLVQETFLKVHTNADKYVEQGTLLGWMRTILWNLYMNEYRKKKSARVTDVVDDFDRLKVNLRPAENGAVSSMVVDDARHALQKLPYDLRSVMELYIMEGQKMDDISGILSVPIGTVKARIHHARRMMVSYDLKEYATTSERKQKVMRLTGRI